MKQSNQNKPVSLSDILESLRTDQLKDEMSRIKGKQSIHEVDVFALSLIKYLSYDNGHLFVPTREQWDRLVAGLKKMKNDGFVFIPWNSEQLAAGEIGEINALFGHFAGFEEVDDVLNDIFENSEDCDSAADLEQLGGGL